ncbi:MAG: hypothetical protein AAGA81_12940 [Acidobacteriota bacterium]
MLSLDDDLWNALLGAYGIPYDPRRLLVRLRRRPQLQSVVRELRERLAGEGSVGTASYAAVPHLLRAGRLDLALEIETARYAPGNPPVPGWMRDDYEAEWVDFLKGADTLGEAERLLLQEIAETRREQIGSFSPLDRALSERVN